LRADSLGTAPRKLVVLTGNTVHTEVVERLRTRATIRILEACPDEATLKDACHEADAILARLGVVTAGVIDAAPVAAMKPGAVLVNTARRTDRPARPDRRPEIGTPGRRGAGHVRHRTLPPASELRSMPNVLLSPRVAGQAGNALLRVGHAAAQAILDEFDGRRPAFVVNPEAYDLRSQSGQH
jgi:phosphoglycerate dehydrogenase-like enzyme